MTDYTDLIARLRGYAACMDIDAYASCDEAADALEKQTKIIESLHKDLKFMDGKNDDLRALLENDRDTIDELRARIAELEARLKKYDPIEILGDQRKTVSVPARAAYLGEKKNG